MSKFEELINGDKPVLVDFFAEWCGPCQQMPPILKQVKDNFGEKLSILKIDVDKNPQVSQAFDIQGVPTLILFRKGEIMWRKSGVVPPGMLTAIINDYVAH